MLVKHISGTRPQWVNTTRGQTLNDRHFAYETCTFMSLTHWGWVTHICVSKLTIIGSDNGLSPGRHQAIIWTNAGILLFGTLETNFSEILTEIHILLFRKMHLKMSSGNWRPFCLGLNVLNRHYIFTQISPRFTDVQWMITNIVS